jgi:hypothetical protein
LGWVSALDLDGRTIWIVDAHGYGKRFIVRAEEKLTAFLGTYSAIRKTVLTLSVAVWQTPARVKSVGVSPEATPDPLSAG